MSVIKPVRQVLGTMGIENVLSVTGTEGPKMVAALEEHVRPYAVDIMNLQRAEKLIPADADNSDWLEGTLDLSPRGEILVDERGQISRPGVFAAGDVTTVLFKQIIVAKGEGSKAALSAFDHLIRSAPPAQVRKAA